MNKKLTKKQKQVYDFICDYLNENGYSPTQVEIQQFFGLKSLGSVQDYIKYLTMAGYLKSDSNAVRGLEPLYPDMPSIPSASENSLDIPLLGNVAAGTPIEVVEAADYIAVPSSMIGKGKYFALNVVGNSMIDDGIFNGDVIVVKEQKDASNGQTVIAVVDNEATVKRLQKKNTHIELIPANESLRPIIVPFSKNFEIKGIVVGLLRVY